MLITPQKKEGIRLIPKTASVSIILPFEPKMASYSTMKETITKAFAAAESALLKNYQAPEVLPIINRLKCISKRIYYDTHKKSIAIFAGANFEKIFYLDVPVEETISVTDTFQLKDLIRIKKVKKEYLVLVLDNKNVKIFIGNSFGLIKMILHDIHDVNEKSIHSAKISFGDYFSPVDKSLSLIIKAYPLPVFVIGDHTKISRFADLSKNKKNIVRYIHEDAGEITGTIIQKLVSPYLDNWDKIRELLLLRKMKAALKEKKLKLGIQQVWESALKRNTRLLIIEDHVFSNVRHLQIPINSSLHEVGLKTPFYIKDPVDDLIEKTLDNGGEIEFCGKGILTNHGHIALITQY